MLLMSLLWFRVDAELAAQKETSLQPPEATRPIAARVDGQAIRTVRLQHELDRLQRTRQVRPAAQPALKAQLLGQVVDQLLILRYLEYSDQGARPVEIDLAIDNLQKRIEQQDQTLDQYLQDQGLNQAELRQKVAWQIGWARYLNRYLTEKNYQRYFEQHRREFDGTQLQVAHVLLKLNRDASDAVVKRQQDAMQQIRKQIESGKLSFSEAAKQFSQSPTGQRGGDLGWIQRNEPMPEQFSVAAFQLRKGEVSTPIQSPFGIHLIECREVKAGNKTWQQVRDPLKQAITKYLFEWSAQRQREQVRVEFTGAWPHFRPGTKTLVTTSPDVESRP